MPSSGREKCAPTTRPTAAPACSEALAARPNCRGHLRIGYRITEGQLQGHGGDRPPVGQDAVAGHHPVGGPHRRLLAPGADGRAAHRRGRRPPDMPQRVRRGRPRVVPAHSANPGAAGRVCHLGRDAGRLDCRSGRRTQTPARRIGEAPKSVGQSGSARFSFNRPGPGLQPDTTTRTSPQRTVKGSRPDLQHEMRPHSFWCSPGWEPSAEYLCPSLGHSTSGCPCWEGSHSGRPKFPHSRYYAILLLTGCCPAQVHKRGGAK